MEPAFRQAYNAAYTPATYQRYLDRIYATLGVRVPFRVAETPLFLPAALRARLERASHEIVARISDPALIAHLDPAVPVHLRVPRRDAIANCIQVDFAIVQGDDGELDGRLVELQGFPSLYAFTVFQSEALAAELRTMPGLDRDWTCLFGGLDRERYVEHLRDAIVGGHDPAEVILMDLDPPSQKTMPDFVATKRLLGVDAVCPTDLRREGRTLYRVVDGQKVQVRRVYNRVVFDELLAKGINLPFSYGDDLDVSWVPHPDWYWVWSKYTIPHVDHPTVPKSWRLSELPAVPDELSQYVLKPLFSFAGTGVKIDVTRADLDAIPDADRGNWLLQERIHYAPALRMPDGQGVKAEVRMMLLRAPHETTPRLVMNLARLSRGKMHGVDHNRDLEWVGGTVGIWPADA